MAGIYLGNLSWGLDEDALGAIIAETAEPTELVIQRNKYGKSLGYALAKFATPKEAQDVIEALHGAQIDGRDVNCREDRGPRVKPAPAATNRVYVGNLNWETTDEDLLEFFTEFNAVAAEVKYHASGASKGWGIVQLGSAEDAVEAIEELNDSDFGGRNVVCRLDRGPRGGNSSPGAAPNGGSSARAPRQRRPAREPRVIEEGPPSTSVFIGNLSWSVNDSGLTELLINYDVEEASVQTRPDGKSRGYALVRFASVEEASRAIEELNGEEVMERNLVVKFDAK